MKYVFFALECYPLPIAKHLIDEGHDVLVAIISSADKLEVPGVKSDEKWTETIQRMSVYDGMLAKRTLTELINILGKVPRSKRDDYFFFFDFNDTYNIAARILAMGFRNGLFPTQFYYKMEKERDRAKAFVKKHYPDITVTKSFDFKTAKDGISFLEKSAGRMYVLKSNGNHAKTLVPKTEDEEKCNEILIEALKENGKSYEEGGFLLEEKIANCLEVTPVMVFYNGEPVYSLIELENKEIGAGNIGPQKGGNLALSIRTPMDCAINNMAFPDVVHEMAKKHPGLAIFDMGLLYCDGVFYFTEFCAMRYGWDGIFSEMVMRDDGEPFVGAYFQDIVGGNNPLINTYGASVRLFNIASEMEFTEQSEGGIPIHIDDGIENNLFLYRVKQKGKKIVSVGGRDLLGVATGSSNIMETAVGKAYDVVRGVTFDRLYYRPKFDFLSTDYQSSILNRLAAMKPFIEETK